MNSISMENLGRSGSKLLGFWNSSLVSRAPFNYLASGLKVDRLLDCFQGVLGLVFFS